MFFMQVTQNKAKSHSRLRATSYFFLKKYVTSEGAVSHSVLYFNSSPLLVTKKRFYAYNYFE